jgi:hypothetical protein
MLLQVLGKVGAKSGVVILNPRVEALLGQLNGLPKMRYIASCLEKGDEGSLSAFIDKADKRTSDSTSTGQNRRKRCKKRGNEKLSKRDGENTCLRSKKRKLFSSTETGETAQPSPASGVVEEVAIPQHVAEPGSELEPSICPEWTTEFEKSPFPSDDFYLNDYNYDKLFGGKLPDDLFI